jgi:hypothetical protein
MFLRLRANEGVYQGVGFDLQGIYWRNRGHVCIVYLDAFVQLSGGLLTACNYDNIVLIGQVIHKWHTANHQSEVHTQSTRGR